MDTDVVVVGYGAAGAATAIAAREAGAHVVVLEKMPEDVTDDQGEIVEIRHTPNSRLAAGIVLTPTDPEAAFAYQKALTEAYGVSDVSDEMLRVWATTISENETWLSSLAGDIEYFAAAEDGPLGLGGGQYPELPGAASTRRIQNKGGGYGLFRHLDTNVRSRGAEIHYGTPAVRLIQDSASGDITGVVANRDGAELHVNAHRAVVLTTGGFEFNDPMKASYLRVWPSRFYGNPANTGDGIRMAQAVGADLWHMNNISGMAVASWPGEQHSFWITPWLRSAFLAEESRDGEPLPNGPPSYGAVIVDGYGRRFAQEIYKPYSFYWEMSYFDTDRAEFPRIPSHMIFDERTRLEGPIANPSGPFGPLKLYEWSADNTAEIEKGWIRKADTIGHLAELIGVPTEALEQTITDWNRYCREGADPEQGRDPTTLTPIDTPPYYEIIQWPGSGNTLGGPRRDENARVLSTDGNPIPRLYSAGELGSIYGFLYQGGGNLAECIAFGRIAGANAAAEAPRT
jgi:succinate dehydrogenase/fumarate reductase flavoprotein subunit